MGIGYFYKWLTEKYPKVVRDSKTTIMEYDCLYVDMNPIIHECFHPEDPKISPPSTWEEVFSDVCQRIDRLVSTVMPQKLIYLAIDGVAPRAKMNLQRARRFRTSREDQIREAEEERLRAIFEMKGLELLPKQESETSDSNIISPGTEFMCRLSKALTNHIYSRMSDNSHWKDIKVFLSDANVPGEGEHKIMSFIRGQRNLPGYNPNTRHCLFGSDTDLIMLALATHEPHFSILREGDQLLDIWILREYLQLEMNLHTPKNHSMDLERIIDDFIFICFIAGNDFLPPMPTLDVREGAIDLLIYVYKTHFGQGDYLVDITRIGETSAEFVKLSEVERFILEVATYESQIFERRAEIKKNLVKKTTSRHKHFEGQKRVDSLSDIESGSSSVKNSDSQILQNTKDLKKELYRCMDEKSDLLNTGDFLTDKLRLGSVGAKRRYYGQKFSVVGRPQIDDKRREVVQKYTEGLVWVLQYYFSDVASWSWFYPYYYAPFASDMKGMRAVQFEFEKGAPFAPFDQLLCVLPPKSAYALPQSYSRLMIDEDSKIVHWYPHDFEVDIDGKRFMRQGICKLPWIEEELLLTETREIQNGLSENERIRNSVNVDRLFVRTSNTCSCVDYEPPVGDTSHTPHLLLGLILPAETLNAGDMKKTRLWHEGQRFDRRKKDC